MNESLRPEVEEAVAAALELPELEQSAYVARNCAHDPALRAEVETLLRAYRAAGSFLEPRSPYLTDPPIVAVNVAPFAIGPYRIMRLLGEGGMGIVYEAEQEHPRRTVALKVLKPGMALPELLRRFEQESEALGRLQHAGIAQVYEVGTADSGFGPQPYFVMELIRGESLLKYAETQGLKLRQRLTLMARVCEAVHHAHQRGIIHRDLKPGNISVDHSGQPKVLDFGVARVMDGDPLTTRHTEWGQMVGTPAYMSPEQMQGDPFALDSRSDVYSLGVILFELLAGRLPYELSRHLHEAMATIREADPVLLGSIDRTYRGDIETIVAKALEKDKARRYSSAADLAADIGCYLQDEPITARSPTLSYQLWKFTRRHRALVAGVAAVFAVLICGIIITTWEAARARQAGETAIAERNRAVAEKERADKESAAAKAINDFLQNDLLAQASARMQARPDTRPDPELKVRTALDRAAARITGKFHKQPLVEASIRRTIGKTYKDLGLYPDAHRQMERALELHRRILGDEHPDSLDTAQVLADVFADQGKYADAESLLVRVFDARKRVLGERHPGTLATMNALAAVYAYQGKYGEAEPLYIKVLNVQRYLLGEQHPDTLLSLNNLARLIADEGRYAEAEPLCVKVLDGRRRVLGEEHPDTLFSKDNLGRLYMSQGKYGQAERLFLVLLAARRRVLGQDHPDTIVSMNNLAVAYRKQGKFEQATSMLTKALELQRRRLGIENPDTLLMMNNLARAYLDQGRYAQAAPLLEKAVDVQCRVLGEQHPDTLVMMRNLARLYHAESKLTQAEALFTKVVQRQRRLLGPDHPDTLSSMTNLAGVYMSQGKYAEAESLYGKVLEVRQRILGAEHPDIASVLVSLGEIKLGQRRYKEAEPLLREALRHHEKTPDNWGLFSTQSMLGFCLAAQTKFTEAEWLLVSGYEGLVQKRAAIPWDLQSLVGEAGDRIVRFYEATGEPVKATQWRERLIAARSAGPSHSIPRWPL